jgi:phospholipid/cholesterol/gamma-HCH transport system permease protein
MNSGSRSAAGKGAAIRSERRGEELFIHLSGRLDGRTIGSIWNQAHAVLSAGIGRVTVDASRVEYCDGVGLALLQHLHLRAKEGGTPLQVVGLAERFQRLLDQFTSEDLLPPPPEWAPSSTLAGLGRVVAAAWHEIGEHVEFVGRVTAALFGALRGRYRIRWRETLRVAESMGADAFPMVALLAFLSGAVISLKVSRSLMQFGDMTEMATFNATAMTSTLAPLLTTVIVVGRSTSAFAAELAAMRVNEELDALVVMGIDPVSYLAVGRVLAGIVSVPLLSVFFELFGNLGGLAIWLSFGLSAESYLQQVRQSIELRTVLGSVVKVVAFGAIAAMLGCFYGLRRSSGSGTRAVAGAATRAVVVGILVIAITDAAFAVLFYFLKV